MHITLDVCLVRSHAQQGRTVLLVIMSELELHAYPLPYMLPEPPTELFFRVETATGRSDTAAFETGLDTRDLFFGMRRCVICANPTVERCHIIPHEDGTVVRPMSDRTRSGLLTFFLVGLAQAVNMGPARCQSITSL